jgi:selenide,water dikinase
MQVLHQIPMICDPRVLVGRSEADDAAVYEISDDLAVVQTVDYFTPIVDDPYTFGAIAAANSLSDIYAMGAKPVMALNIVGFPVDRLSLEVLVEILRGGSDKAKEAGISIAGGHTIDGIMTNSGAKPGDVLILTKPIGTGIISTAMKAEIAPQESIDIAVKIMSTLNRAAARSMMEVGVNSCTDVTGFGLLGHLYEMISASHVGAEVSLKKVPLIPGTRELADDLIIPAGTGRNHEFLRDHVIWGNEIEYEEQMILCDAQTSGGLLISVPEKNTAALIRSLEDSDTLAAQVGGIVEDETCKIRVC